MFTFLKLYDKLSKVFNLKEVKFMSISVHNVTYKDLKELSVELEYIVACNRVAANELINIILENVDMLSRFRNSATKILKGMKRDGVIQLFVFEDELNIQEKMESIYLLNKFSFLSKENKGRENSVYIKL